MPDQHEKSAETHKHRAEDLSKEAKKEEAAAHREAAKHEEEKAREAEKESQ